MILWSGSLGLSALAVGAPELPAYCLAFTCGFFIWDLINQILHPEIHGVLFTFHAVAGFILSFLSMHGYIQWQSMTGLIVETSSILLQLSWFLKRRARLYGDPGVYINLTRYLFAATFLIVRIGFLPVVLLASQAALHRDWHLIHLPYQSAFDMLGIPSSYVTTVIFYSISICNCSLFVLNVHWGTLIFLKIARSFRASGSRE
jgi:hypothetical protein